MVSTAAAPTRSRVTSCVTAAAARLPAALPLATGRAGLGCLLARVLALVEVPLEHRQREDDQRERGDEDEAGVGDDLVVRLAPPALALVVGQRRRGEQQEQRDGDRQEPQHGPDRIEASV